MESASSCRAVPSCLLTPSPATLFRRVLIKQLGWNGAARQPETATRCRSMSSETEAVTDKMAAPESLKINEHLTLSCWICGSIRPEPVPSDKLPRPRLKAPFPSKLKKDRVNVTPNLDLNYKYRLWSIFVKVIKSPYTWTNLRNYAGDIMNLSRHFKKRPERHNLRFYFCKEESGELNWCLMTCLLVKYTVCQIQAIIYIYNAEEGKFQTSANCSHEG